MVTVLNGTGMLDRLDTIACPLFEELQERMNAAREHEPADEDEAVEYLAHLADAIEALGRIGDTAERARAGS